MQTGFWSGNLEDKRPIERSRHRHEYYVKSKGSIVVSYKCSNKISGSITCGAVGELGTY